MQTAQYIGKYNGKRYYRVPVTVSLNSSRACATLARVQVQVIAPSAAAAANYMRDEYALRPETEIHATGPKGGDVLRYVGWESAIGNALFAPKQPQQLSLSF